MYSLKNNYTSENNEINIKKYILNYVYDKISLKEYKFQIIKTPADIFDIKNNKYYITPNYGGMPFLLIFIKLNNINYCYLIDRRTLSFEKHKLNINSVSLIKVDIQDNDILYDGSIFDCCIIDPLLNNKKQIIILDTFYFCGNNFLTMNYLKKNLLIMQYCELNLINDNNSIIFYNIKIFEFSQINILFNEYIKENYKKLNIKGIALYPHVSRIKLIYVFNKEDINYKDKLINDKEYIISSKIEKNEINNSINDDKNKIIIFELKDINYNEEIILNFELFKTTIIDVYKMYSIFFENNKYFKRKIGIAYISSYEKSIKMRKIFEFTNKMIIACKFNIYNKKWIPIDRPVLDKMNVINIDDRLKIII